MVSFLLFNCTESSKEQFAYTNVAEELVKLFKKQIEHDKKEMIFEVLAPLAENGEILSTSFISEWFIDISFIDICEAGWWGISLWKLEHPLFI